MTAIDGLERRLTDHFATEVPRRAPDRVLGTALATIDTTPQRRVLVRAPWRFPTMNGFARWAVAAVAVIAVGAIGLAVLRPGSAPGVGGPPVASPSPTSSPSPDPSAPPPLGSTFASTVHGITISYPTGWVATSATEPWTPGTVISLESGVLDHVADPVLSDHLFVGIWSQPLGSGSGQTWASGIFGTPGFGDGCATGPVPITIDAASGLLCGEVATFWSGDRGWVIWEYLSADEPWLTRYYDEAWFRNLLNSIALRPGDARPNPTSSAPRTPTPSPS